MNGTARLSRTEASAGAAGTTGRGGSSSRHQQGIHHRHRVTFNEPKLQDAGSWFDTLLSLATAGVASVCLCGLLTMLCVLFVTVRPFSETMYRRLCAQMGFASFLDALALLLPNIKIYLTADSDIPSLVGTSMIISNHVCVGDWWVILMLGRCVGLGGSVKVFLRNEYLNIKMNTNTPDNAVISVLPSPSNNNASSSGAGTSNSQLLLVPHRPGGETNGKHHGNHHGSAAGTTAERKGASPDLSLMARLLHQFLEFPLFNGEDYALDKERLFPLLRSFAQSAVGAGAPVHLAFFPEGWSLHNGADRQTLLGKSNEFAKKEGRPQLKHLLLPRTRGFNSCLDSLRDSSPSVYDVTMAYPGYDGSLPPSMQLSMTSLWHLFRGRFPREFHIRVRRYTIEEVVQDSAWLDKRWQEKDRLLSHFTRHQSFLDGRRNSRQREFNTRSFGWESSLASMIRLLVLPFSIPILALISIPFFWTLLFVWVVNSAIELWQTTTNRSSGGGQGNNDLSGGDSTGQAEPVTPASVNTTPFIPATPFGSPASLMPWFSKRSDSPKS